MDELNLKYKGTHKYLCNCKIKRPRFDPTNKLKNL